VQSKLKLQPLACIIVLLAAGALMPGLAGAQPPTRGDNLDQANIAPAEIQRLFDAYALVQAQDALKLGDDQYPTFLARYKGLQEVRRRAQNERTRMIRDLVRLAAPDAKSDEGPLRDGLKALQDLDARAAADIRKAYEGIDQVLDLRQQVRFRVFEEQMERRKFELVTIARQNNRAKNRPNPARRGQP
jgi:hypothetical protein